MNDQTKGGRKDAVAVAADLVGEREAFEFAMNPSRSRAEWMCARLRESYYSTDLALQWQGWQAARASRPTGEQLAERRLRVLIDREHLRWTTSREPTDRMASPVRLGETVADQLNASLAERSQWEREFLRQVDEEFTVGSGEQPARAFRCGNCGSTTAVGYDTAPPQPGVDREHLRRELSSLVRSILSQGHAQEQDYAAGKYMGYEMWTAHWESTIAPRVEQFLALLNGEKSK